MTSNSATGIRSIGPRQTSLRPRYRHRPRRRCPRIPQHKPSPIEPRKVDWVVFRDRVGREAERVRRPPRLPRRRPTHAESAPARMRKTSDAPGFIKKLKPNYRCRLGTDEDTRPNYDQRYRSIAGNFL